MPKKHSELLRYLESLAPDEIAAEIKELYRLFPAVREYYQVKIYGDGEAMAFNKYKRVVKNEFFPERGLGKIRLSVARRAVSDFLKISRIPFYQAEIMLYFVETGVKFTNAYGDIYEPFYNSMGSMYEKAARFVTAHGLERPFQERFHAIVRDTSHIGWGFHDELSHMYQQYFLKKVK